MRTAPGFRPSILSLAERRETAPEPLFRIDCANRKWSRPGLGVQMMRLFQRPPDLVIGSAGRPYMLRWHVIPQNRWFNVYLHKIVRSDEDRALHDHPWWSVSLLLAGEYTEITSSGMQVYGRGSIIFRKPEHRHRLVVNDGQHVWSLFITGPKVREWGFWCPQGFVVWHDFVDKNDTGNIGRGCGEN